MEGRMHKLLVGLALVLLPALAGAQAPMHAQLTVGPSLINASGSEGSGLHVTASFPIATTVYGVQWSAIAFAMNGSTEGSPFQCKLVNWEYCFGRSERLKAGSIGVGAGRGFRLLGMSAYARSQIGAFAEQVRAHEVEGPTKLCFSGAAIVSCPDNPPFRDYASAGTTMGGGGAFGVGVAHDVLRTRLSLEVTAHRYRTRNRRISMLWVGAGIGF